jgi:hypothetical protein
MKNLTHTEALQIVVAAARSYAKLAADREGKAHSESAAEIWQAIETLQTPPLFQSTFRYSE